VITLLDRVGWYFRVTMSLVKYTLFSPAVVECWRAARTAVAAAMRQPSILQHNIMKGEGKKGKEKENL